MEQYAEVVLDLAGNAVPGASVQVLVGSVNGGLATIFDAGGTPQQNPIVTGALGDFAFQVANGKYVLRVLVKGTPYRTVGPLTFYDPNDDTRFGSLDPQLRTDVTSLIQGAAQTANSLAAAQRKLAETVSLGDYGSKGDGTDSTVAWSAALAKCYSTTPYSELEIPAGVHPSSARIELRPGMRVRGAGRRNTVIKYTGSGIAVRLSDDIKNNGDYAFGGAIEDLTIEGNANSTSLLYVKNVNHCVVRDVNLRESSTTVGVGLHVLGTVCGYFENIICSTNEQLMTNRPNTMLVVDRDPTTLSRATANTFVHLVLEGSIGDGMQLINSDQSLVIGGTSENHNGNGVTVAAGSRMNTFISMAFENSHVNTFADIYDAGFSNRFINCYSRKQIYIATSALYCKIEGGFHQRIVDTGDFTTLCDFKYSFFEPGGTVSPNSNASTRNLFNANTSSVSFFPKAPVPLSVGPSPFTYTNGSGLDESIILQGGAITQLVFNRGGAVATLPGAGMYPLAPTDGVTVSYAEGSPPIMVRLPSGTNFN